MTLVWVCGKIHFINIKTYSSHQTYSSSLIKLHAAHLIVNSSWVVRSHHSWYDRDVSQAEGIYSELWKGGVILSAVRRWGGGQPDRLSGRWKLWFWGDLVEANQQHPKYTTRALRLCGLVSLVQTGVQGNDLQRKSSVILYRPSMVLVDWGSLVALC